MNDARSDYERSRMQVLFKVWCPGSKQVALAGILCRHCGYATYEPRPTASDIHSKYEFQKKSQPNQGVNLNRDALRLDRKRAEKVLRRLKPFLPPGKLRILDYGGGNGRMMSPFLNQRHDCFIVDYNENPVGGVTHLGCTLSDLSPNTLVDVIVCSHVIEHQAEPAKIVTELVSHLTPTGLLYAEVPAELFDGIPIERDPVTHVGFFCRASLEALLQLAGFRILKSRAQVGTYNERALHILWAIGQRTADSRPPNFSVAAENARRCLNPHFFERVMRRLHPQCLWGKVRQHFHHHHPARKFLRRWLSASFHKFGNVTVSMKRGTKEH